MFEGCTILRVAGLMVVVLSLIIYIEGLACSGLARGPRQRVLSNRKLRAHSQFYIYIIRLEAAQQKLAAGRFLITVVVLDRPLQGHGTRTHNKLRKLLDLTIYQLDAMYRFIDLFL